MCRFGASIHHRSNLQTLEALGDPNLTVHIKIFKTVKINLQLARSRTFATFVGVWLKCISSFAACGEGASSIFSASLWLSACSHLAWLHSFSETFSQDHKVIEPTMRFAAAKITQLYLRRRFIRDEESADGCNVTWSSPGAPVRWTGAQLGAFFSFTDLSGLNHS